MSNNDPAPSPPPLPTPYPLTNPLEVKVDWLIEALEASRKMMQVELMGRLGRLQDEQTTMLELLNDSTGISLLSRVRHLEEEVRELKDEIRKLQGAGK